jgi:uncharacterized protein (PEP-CTERM system associated)
MSLPGRSSSCRRIHGAGGLALLASMLAAGTALAGDWRIQPSIGVTETITDNARSTSNNREADLITTVSPGVAVSGTGRRLTLDFNYDFNYDKYLSNTDLDGIRQNFTGAGLAELIREAVFLDVRGSISQEFIDRRGAVTATERSGAGNQTDVYTYSLSPYWRSRYGGFAESELRYRFAQSFFGQPSSDVNDDINQSPNTASDATTHQFSGNLISGADFGNLLWRLSGDAANTDRDRGKLETRNVDVALQYAITRTVSILGGGGYDDIQDPTLIKDLTGPYWNTGVQLTPSPRTKVRVLGGRRYNDTNYAGELSYQPTARTLLTASYTDTILTEQTQFLTNLDNVERDQYGNFIDRRTGVAFASRNPGGLPLTDDVFRDKTANANFRYFTDRNTYTATVYYTQRESQSAPVAGTEGTAFNPNDETVIGTSLSFGRRLSDVMDAGLTVGYSRSKANDAGDNSSDNTYFATASLGYLFNPTLRGAISYTYFNRQTKGGTPASASGNDGGDDLLENVVVVSLRKFF